MQTRIFKGRNPILCAIEAALLALCLAVPAGLYGADLSALVEPGRPERIATGFGFAEGPVWHPEGYLLFSDIPNSTIYKWTPDGKLEKFRAPSGKSNGLTVDQQGRLIACEHGNRRVSRTETDGTVVSLADRYDGKRLNSPNDVVVRSDGSIYFTDPPYGLLGYTPHPDQTEPGMMELSFSGVYKLSPDSKTLTLLTKDLQRPNGLAFSPDEKILYVADTERHRINAFDVKPDGTLANSRIFAKTLFGEYPDGIKTDASGDLYVTTNLKGIRVYDSTGKPLGVIETDSDSANCAFGGSDNKMLFVAAQESVYVVKMKVPGARTTVK
jgi:sugar lactone lactonase YvrE